MQTHRKPMLKTIVLVSLFLAVRAHAGITIDTDIGGLESASVGKTAIFIADLNNSGVSISDLQLNASTVNTKWSLDTNDLVLGVYPFTAIELTVAIDASPGGVNLPGGTPLYVVWYPNLTYSSSLTGPGTNQPFGVYRDALGDQGYGLPYIGFNVPATDGAFTLYRGDGEDGYSGATLSGFQTIPEPSSALLVLCGLGMLRMLQRRKT